MYVGTLTGTGAHVVPVGLGVGVAVRYCSSHSVFAWQLPPSVPQAPSVPLQSEATSNTNWLFGLVVKRIWPWKARFVRPLKVTWIQSSWPVAVLTPCTVTAAPPTVSAACGVAALQLLPSGSAPLAH